MNRRTAIKLLAGTPLVAMAGGIRPKYIAQAPAPVVPEGPEKIPPPREVRWSIPSEAVIAAQQDAMAVQQASAIWLPFARWIWIQRGEGDEFRAVADALNKISRATTPIIPVLTQGILVRIDLRWYYPRVNDLQEALEQWENLQFDPMFSLLLTGDTLRLLTLEQRSKIKVTQRKTEWAWRNNAWFDTGKKRLVQVPLLDVKNLVVERTNAPHLAGSEYEKLQEATGSLAPIVSSGYLITRILSTIKDKDKVDGKDRDNLFSLVWGGLYYEFAGIRKSVVKGRSDLDQLLQDLGVGGDKDKFRELFERLRSDENSVLIRSEITGKRRRIRWFPTLATRLTQAYSVIFLTEDIRDRDKDFGTDPLANPLDSVPKAFEVIFNAPNGQQKFALFNDVGTLLEQGADEVVSDHRIPRPITTRLQSGISCIRCHGPDGGWQPFVNDLKTNLKSSTIFGDVSRLNDAVTDTLDRLKGLNDGDPTLLLRRLRADYQRTTLLSTGPWSEAGLQLDLVQRSSVKISQVWARERWDQVDAAQALRTMGVPPVGDGTLQFKVLVPPDEFSYPSFDGVVREDPRIVPLKDGRKINWDDFQLLYSFALTRVLRELQKDK